MVARLYCRLSTSFFLRQQQLLVEPLRLFPSRHICKLCSVSTSKATQPSHLPQTTRLLRVSNTARAVYHDTPSPSPQRTFTTTTTTNASSKQGDTMSSDQDYMAFLNQANEDPSRGTAKAQGQGAKTKKFRTTQEGIEVPRAIARVCGKGDAFYVSEADEPFEAVALGWDEGGRGLPDEEEFAGLIEHWDPKNADVEILDPVDWDSRGQYGEIVDAVREAGQGNDVRVYRVGRDGARVEYWVVTTEGKGEGAKLVGAKALAVES